MPRSIAPVLYVRRGSAERGDAEVTVATAEDLALGAAAEPPIDAHTEIAARRDGPFAPAGEAIARRAAVRDALAALCDLELARAWSRLRPWAAAALVPLLMLAELDRELVVLDAPGARGRLACDLVLTVAVLADVARRLPRFPRVTAIVLFAAAARFALFVARACGRAHPAILLAGGLAVGCGTLIAARAPSPAAVTRALFERLAWTAPASSRAAPPRATVAAATIAALGLPVILFAAEKQGIALWPRAALYAAYAAFVPFAIERAIELRARPRAAATADAALATAIGFVLALGLANGAHYAVDAIALAARCVSPAGAARTAQRLLDAEALEVRRGVQQARDEWAFFAMNVLVVPLAEERVYRDLLQRALVGAWGRARGVAAASLIFGVAHLAVYHLAVYQTVLLGVSFGIAYAEGGLWAAAAAHALWNLHLLL